MESKSDKRRFYSALNLTVIFLYYCGLPLILYFTIDSTRRAFFIYVIFLYLKRFIMTKILGLVQLTILDEMFLIDYPQNRANILTVMKISKVRDAEVFRRFLVDKITAFERCRSKLVKVMHEYYFKELTGNELALAKYHCFKILDINLSNDHDLTSFLEKEQAIRDPLDTFQYKVFIQKDYSETESLLILKSHHCMCDGIATLVMTSSFSRDGYE